MTNNGIDTIEASLSNIFVEIFVGSIAIDVVLTNGNTFVDDETLAIAANMTLLVRVGDVSELDETRVDNADAIGML